MTDNTAEQLRLQGNAFFRTKQYTEAKQCYQRGFALDPSDSLIPLNLALAHIKLDEFPQALTACNARLQSIESDIAKLETQRNKAIYRKAQALIGLGDFKEARALSAQYPMSEVPSFPRSDLRAYLQGRPACVANGGGVQVQESPDMGRVLVAQKAFEPGDCVLCDRALLWVWMGVVCSSSCAHV